MDALKKTCEHFERSMKHFSEQIEAAANSALEEFKIRQTGRVTRKKRFDPISLAIGGAVVLGLWAVTEIVKGRHERKQLFEKVSTLERDVGDLAESIKIMGESFIGFSNAVSQAFENYDNKLEMLKNFSIEQAVHARESLNNVTKFMDDKTTLVAIMSTFNDYRLSQANILQNNLIILLDGLNQYESIFNSLQDGRLSHLLMPWSKLHKILDHITRQYSKDFEFAINDINKDLYYSLPLTSYSIDAKTDDIYVSLRIPLTRRSQPKIYSIIKPESSPFTCLNQECFNYNNEPKTIHFQVTSNLWLVHPLTGDLMQEVSEQTITCDYSQHKKVCFTFNRNQMSQPSECSRALHKWDPNLIISTCPIKPRPISEYRPISIGYDRYIIHRNVVPRYDILCHGKNVLSIQVMNWSEIIKLEKNCDVYLPSIKRMLYAPYADPLKSKDIEIATTFHSEILELIDKASNQSQLEFLDLEIERPDLPDYKPFKPEEHRVVLD